MSRLEIVIGWICRLTASIILLQTLFFKFSGAEESVYIFSKVGMEPWGRYATGTLELIAAALLIFGGRTWLGALLAMGLMAGAIACHLTVLGIVVKDDGGLLFALALTVFVCAAIVALLNRSHIPVFSQFVSKRSP